jgi:hypothetical protein
MYPVSFAIRAIEICGGLAKVLLGSAFQRVSIIHPTGLKTASTFHVSNLIEFVVSSIFR